MTEPTPKSLQRSADSFDLGVDDNTAALLAEQFTQQNAVLESLGTLETPDPPECETWEPDPEEDDLGAWLTRCDVSRETGGPREKLSVGVKDNVAVAGVPMTCGSPLLPAPAYVPDRDATVVDRLLDAGGRIVGKTNMDDFAFGGDDATALRAAAAWQELSS